MRGQVLGLGGQVLGLGLGGQVLGLGLGLGLGGQVLGLALALEVKALALALALTPLALALEFVALTPSLYTAYTLLLLLGLGFRVRVELYFGTGSLNHIDRWYHN